MKLCTMNIETKLRKLENILRGLGKTAVAFSGGADSVFLAEAARRAPGVEVLAVTAVSATLTGAEKAEAVKLAKQLGVRHALLRTAEFGDRRFTENSAERCYYCKKIRFTALAEWARRRGYRHVIEGSNADDAKDYRPGSRAVAELACMSSPLKEAGLTKAEIRAVSRRWNLPTWDKPAAACLASRVEYGLPLTPRRLRQVAAAEKFIRPLCEGQLRVRHHGALARIEVEPEWIPRLAKPGTAAKIAAKLKRLGFHHTALDLAGYSMGSMNRDLEN